MNYEAIKSNYSYLSSKTTHKVEAKLELQYLAYLMPYGIGVLNIVGRKWRKNQLPVSPNLSKSCLQIYESKNDVHTK